VASPVQTQRFLSVLAGRAVDGRKVYAGLCRADDVLSGSGSGSGLAPPCAGFVRAMPGRHLGLLVGRSSDGQKVYGNAECCSADAGIIASVLVGRAVDGKKVYAAACCPEELPYGSGSGSLPVSGIGSRSGSGSGSSSGPGSSSGFGSESGSASGSESGSASGLESGSASGSESGSGPESGSGSGESSGLGSVKGSGTGSESSGPSGYRSGVEELSSGFDSGASGGFVTIACCPGVDVPTQLHVTVVAETGNCGIVDFTLDFVGAAVAWEGFDNNGLKWTLVCLGGAGNCFSFQLGGPSYGFQHTPDACVCSPISLTFSGPLAALPFCAGSITVVITA
jgi:hypothetical protein